VDVPVFLRKVQKGFYRLGQINTGSRGMGSRGCLVLQGHRLVARLVTLGMAIAVCSRLGGRPVLTFGRRQNKTPPDNGRFRSRGRFANACSIGRCIGRPGVFLFNILMRLRNGRYGSEIFWLSGVPIQSTPMCMRLLKVMPFEHSGNRQHQKPDALFMLILFEETQ